LRDQVGDDFFDILHRAGAVGIEHADDIAGLAEEGIGHDEVGVARGQDRGDADVALARELRDRAECGDADAAAEHHDMAPGRIEMEADAERADHVEAVALLQRRKPARAAADAFVQKLDAAALPIDAIDALRPAEEQFADVGRRAQQVKELPRRDRERLWRSFDDQMLVFGVHPVVEHHRAQ